MPQNLIKVKQLEQSELTGLMQNVIDSNQYMLNFGAAGTGVNINNISSINLSGVAINFINSTITGGATGYFSNLFINGQSIVTGSAAATLERLNDTGNLLYGYIQQLSGDFDTSGAILNSYINALSGDFNETGAILNNYINNLSGYSVLTYGDQSITGIKTFVSNINVSGTGIFNALDLSNIDNLSLSGVDINLTNGNIISNYPIIGSNLVYNTGNQSISGIKIFANSGIFSLSGASPLTIANNPLSIVGSGNTYIQVNIQNRATGTTATSDLVITANNGTDSSNYLDLGINNSGYNDPTFSNGSQYDGYLFVNGGSLDIGTQTPGKDLEFHIGGTTADRVIARVDNSGINIISGAYRAVNPSVQLVTGSEYASLGWSNNQFVIGTLQVSSGTARDLVLTGRNITINAAGGLNIIDPTMISGSLSVTGTAITLNGSGIVHSGQFNYGILSFHQGGSFTPANAAPQTYYFAQIPDLSTSTTATDRKFQVPVFGRVKRYSINFFVGGTVAVGTTSTAFYLNNITDGTIQTIYSCNPCNNYASTATSIAGTLASPLILLPGKDYNIRLDHGGGFTTAPTTVRHQVNLYVE